MIEENLDGGGTSGLPINSSLLMFLPEEEVKHVDDGGGIWLRTGAVETDVESYPDANTTIIDKVATGIIYDGQTTGTLGANNFVGVAKIGTTIFVLDKFTATVHLLNLDGSEQGVSFSVLGGANTVEDIATNGTNLFVTDVTNWKVHEYTPAGNLVQSFTNLRFTGITWDGTHWWGVFNGDDAVQQLTAGWVTTGLTLSVAAQTNDPRSIAFDGSQILVLEGSEHINRYDTDGTYQKVYSMVMPYTAPEGLYHDIATDTLFIVGGSYVQKYKLDAPIVGNQSLLTVSSLTYYIKIGQE